MIFSSVSLAPQTPDTVPRTLLTSATLSGLCVCASLQLVFGGRFFGLTGAAFFLAFLVVGSDRLRLRERYLMLLSAFAAVAAIATSSHAWPLLSESAMRASYLSAFFLLLTLLRDGAMTSSSVLEVGRFLTRQPPNRRYWALAIGGHLMGVVMNFGALILLAPLVQRGSKEGVADTAPELIAIREQRQLSALMRGFSWFIAWAPTSIAQVVAVAVVTGASVIPVALMGALTAAFVISAGWAEDWLFGRRARQRLGRPTPTTERAAVPRAAFARLGGIYLLLIVLSFTLAWGLDTKLVNGIMLAAAPVTALWITLQFRAGRGDGRSLTQRGRDLVLNTLPDCSPEAATLALAGFTGTVLAGVVPPEALEQVFAIFQGHAGLLYVSLTTLVVAASIIGMPPMLTVTFLGAAASRATGLNLEPNLLALSLVLGWAINLTGSPFGASNLILARHTGVPVTMLAFRWNGRFSLIALGISAAMLLAFA